VILPRDDQSLALKHQYEICTHLYERLGSASNTVRSTFQQLAANTRYYHELLLGEVDRLELAGDNVQVDGKNLAEIQKYFRKLEQKVPEWSD